jgi:transposase
LNCVGANNVIQGEYGMRKYIVKLSKEEREILLSLLKKGMASARFLTHARVLLSADEGELSKSYKTDEQIAKELMIGSKTVTRIRKRFVEEGYEASLNHKKFFARRKRIFDGEQEAQLIALACTPAPKGRVRWTLKLLAQRVVELNIVETVSAPTIGRVLKKRA